LTKCSLFLGINCAESYFIPSRIRHSFAILKQTRLKSAFHEIAEQGDLEKFMEMVNDDPTLLTKYDIDGMVLCPGTDIFPQFNLAYWTVLPNL
jgi:hypothetical protein